jgi:vacuolar protein sorting-associated protein VTA1
MSITLASIPESLKTDKSVSSFIARSIEIAGVNPVVSYYCKLYVLEYILSNKLHTTSKDVERFTIELLDETETLKKDSDESVQQALADKSISLSIVLSFSYKLFNSCLETLSNYTRAVNKQALIGKLRATINFLTILSTFVNGDDSTIDWKKLTGGKANTAAEFDNLNKEKIKVIKYQLSKLIKNEIPFKDEPNDKELEDELDKELAALGDNSETKLPGAPSFLPEEEFPSEKLPETPKFTDDEDNDEFKLPGAPSFLPEDDNNDFNNFKLPSAPKDLDSSDNDFKLPSAPKNLDSGSNSDSEGNVKLPGVPHFPPENSESDSEVKLPGAPKYLPDDDLSHINRNSSIHVFPPDNEPKAHIPAPVKSIPTKPPTNHHPHLTKENISHIVDKTELINKVQKHAKFAISALNYEDIATAERELLQGLELLRVLKLQEES